MRLRSKSLVAVLVAALTFVGSASATSDSSYQAGVYLQQTSASVGALVIKAASGPGILNDNGSVVYNVRVRTSIANVNTGATLLPIITGYKYRLIDSSLIAVGGTVGTCTAVTILATQAAGSATLQSVTAATLAQSVVVKPNTSGSTVLADGASFVQNDVSTAITIGKTGGSCATATNIDAILTFAIE